ncbi:aromatase/cyclase [Streptomyces celluloflavus]|uniref:aromatase/cyclase n=1 Tax=Streptomyces celluloflavus TaxID=58344 RepID=UPI003656E3B6
MPIAQTDFTLTAKVEAPMDRVFDLVADVTQSPRFFPNVIYADRVDENAGDDVVRRWVLAGEQVRSWRSRRRLDRAAGLIAFEHLEPGGALRALGGQWTFKAESTHDTVVELCHTIEAADGTDALTRAAESTKVGAENQLARLKEVAEQYDTLVGLEASYEASLVIKGSLADVYGYFEESERWPERIPHCLAVVRTDAGPDVQVVEMDVRVPSGAVHTTKQVRVCLPGDRIVWRQVGGLPPLDQGLFGYTSFTETPEGVLARAGQTELLKPLAVAKRGWHVDQAREHVAEVRGARNLDALRSVQEYLDRR